MPVCLNVLSIKGLTPFKNLGESIKSYFQSIIINFHTLFPTLIPPFSLHFQHTTLTCIFRPSHITFTYLYSSLFSQGYIPQPSRLCEFVCVPPPPSERVYCTLQKHGDELFGGYILYLEYLGGLIPLLRAKRTSKLKPEFIVYDPKILRSKGKAHTQTPPSPQGKIAVFYFRGNTLKVIFGLWKAWFFWRKLNEIASRWLAFIVAGLVFSISQITIV